MSLDPFQIYLFSVIFAALFIFTGIVFWRERKKPIPQRKKEAQKEDFTLLVMQYKKEGKI
jgi:hypothetical protein